MSGAAEKRTSSRKVFNVPVTVRVLGSGPLSGRAISVSSRDLSATGLSFESEELFPLGAEMEAHAVIPGRKKPVIARMRVMRLESDLDGRRFRIGATFMDLDEAERDFIARAIERVNLNALLSTMIERGASDLHLTVGYPPVMRSNRKLVPMDVEPLEDGEIRAMLYPLLDERKVKLLEKNLDLDYAFSPAPNERFRVNFHFQKGFLEATIRNISSHLKSLSELGVPAVQLERLCQEGSGLILLAGKVGSGKTTTLASMINYINTHFERVIVTVEDPIEFVFTNHKSIIKQRELGRDTRSFAGALKYALRQDPDVIVVGELLEKESVQTALAAAETGHLVIATVHAGNSAQAIEKLVSFFPVEHASSVARKIAAVTKGVLFQMLLPRRDGGMILATELLLNNPGMRNVISNGNFNQIPGMIQNGGTVGMHTLASSVERLMREGEISKDLHIEGVN